MKRRHIATGAVALTTAMAMAGTGAGMAHAASTGNSVRLSNSGRAGLAGTGVRTLGAAPSNSGVTLQIAVPLRNQALLSAMLAKGAVVSPAEYTRMFGASKASLAKVADWARNQGLRVTASSVTSGAVTVQAPVQTVNKAFSLKMQRVSLGARTGLAPNTDPVVPRSLGVSGVVGLTTISTRSIAPIARGNLAVTGSGKRSTLHSTAPASAQGFLRQVSATGSTNCSSYWGQNVFPRARKFSSESNFACGYSPKQVVSLYNAAKASTATPAVGVLLWCDDKSAKAKANFVAAKFSYASLGTYSDQSATPNPQFCKGANNADASSEQSIDIQATHAISPKASIYYYGASDSSDAALWSMFQKAVSQHKVSTISMSWGGDEQAGSFQTLFDRTAAQASLTGISLFASSGDMGDGSIGAGDTKPTMPRAAGYPAVSPYFTAVGGTAVGITKTGARQFTIGWTTSWYAQPDPNSLRGITRYPYPGNAVGAGGGVSKLYAQPSWQKGKVTGSTTKRVIPDISAIADPGTPLAVSFDGKNLTTSGGTSQASPIIASLVASSKFLTKRKIGNAASYFYKLKGTSNVLDVKPVAAGTYGLVYGQDPTTNDLVLEGMGQPSDSLRVTTGWDNVTGLGEPSGSFLTSFGK